MQVDPEGVSKAQKVLLKRCSRRNDGRTMDCPSPRGRKAAHKTCFGETTPDDVPDRKEIDPTDGEDFASGTEPRSREEVHPSAVAASSALNQAPVGVATRL